MKRNPPPRASNRTPTRPPAGRAESRHDQPDQGKGRRRQLPHAAAPEPAGRLRLPGLRMARSPARVDVRILRNGVKAVAAEATSKRVTPDFFAAHTVTELLEQSDFELEQHGRLTDPMVYDAQTDRYVPIAWDDAFALIARHLRALPDPNQAAFYVRPRQQRSGVPVPAARAPVRHEQLPRLLEHVPRGDEPRAADVGRRRQGHRHARRFRTCGHAADLRPEPGHQPPADDGRAARVREARRDDRVDQPAEGARPRTLRRSAKPDRDADDVGHEDRIDVHPADDRRRFRADQGDGEARARTRRRRARRRCAARARHRVHRRAHGRLRRIRRRPAQRKLVGADGRKRRAVRTDRQPRAALCTQRARDRDVGHGHHAAQAFGRDRADADEPDADARQHRPPGAGCARCAATRTCRATARSASRKNRRRHSSTGSATCSTSNRRATTATTSSRRSKGCSKAT